MRPMSVQLDQAADRERVGELLGASDLIKECQEMLRGERQEFTGMEEYLRQRLEYWQERYDALDRRHRERRHAERRSAARAVVGRRTEERRAG
jgi:hypothetical protein